MSFLSIIAKNMQEEQLNPRFPVFPAGISNSIKFPEVVDTPFMMMMLDLCGSTLWKKRQIITSILNTNSDSMASFNRMSKVLTKPGI